MKLKDFLETNNACSSGKEWALLNCTTIHEALNHPQADYSYIKWAANKLLSKEESIELALFCCDLVKHLMKDKRSVEAVEAIRNGTLTAKIRNAADAAYAATYAAAYAAYAADAARAAAAYAAYDAAAYADDAARAAAYAAYAANVSIKPQIKAKLLEILNRHEEYKEQP